MKKKLFLSATELCLSLILIFTLINMGLSDGVYALSEEYPDDEAFPLEIAEGVQKSGQWLYFDKGDHISICGYSGNEEHLTIPSEIEGKTVTELSYGGADLDDYSRPFFGLNSNTYFDSELLAGGDKAVTKRITVPDTVTRIGDNTFHSCVYLEQADLPEGLTYIGSGAFDGCYALVKADIPSTVTVIRDSAFVGTAITSLDLPEGLEYIGEIAFFNTGITRLQIPASVRYIGSSAFAFCWSLEEVTLSEDLATIPETVFRYCIKLRSLKIPEGVQIIGSYAFEGCTGLETLYIPSTAVIMSEILGDNSSLKDIYFNLDRETATALTGSDPISYLARYGDETADYGNVAFHYAEKAEPAPKDSLWDYPVRAVFLVLGITFFLTFIIALCLYLVQKSKIDPKPAPKAATAGAPGGNVLTGLDPFGGIRCTKCGAESGKIADYCHNCGKKLKKKG